MADSTFAPSRLFSLEGRRALVTGGSRGVGAAIAEGLLAAGAAVTITARHSDELEATAERLGRLGPCVPLVADLSDTDGVRALADALEEAPLAVLVNNAGGWWMAPIDAHPEERWDQVMDLNVKSVHYLTAALLPRLRAAATAEDPARVINIGSIEGIDTPMTPNVVYSASKAALHMLSRHHAAMLAGDHVLVNAIAPGVFPSKLSATFLDVPALRDPVMGTIPLGRPGRPEEIAGAAIFLASRAGGYTTGEVLVVDGGRSGIGRADPIAGLGL